MQIQDYFDCNQLVVSAISEFNEHLISAAGKLDPNEPIGSQKRYLLDDDPVRF